MDKDQVIVKDSNSYIVNDGQTSHQGIEWKLRYQLNEGWQVTSTGAWSKHQYTYDRLFSGTTINGNDIDTAPRWQGGAQLLWEPSEQITAELEWVYLGKYFLDPQNAQEYAGHNIFNLTVQKRYAQWDLRLQITNLGDRRIADRADYAFGSYRYFVGEGRGLSLELKRQF